MISVAGQFVSDRVRRMWLCLVATLATTAASLGCGESPAEPHGRVIFDINVHVFAAEGDATRYLLVVGDTLYASAVALTRTCAYGAPTCAGDDSVAFSSSDERVVNFMPGGLRSFDFQFVGRAPGSVVVSATAQGVVRTFRVDVVAAPLPIDSVRVRRYEPLMDSVPAVVDAAGNLVSATLTAREGYVPPVYRNLTTRVVIFRGGDATVFLPVTIEATNPVAGMEFFCTDWPMRCDISGDGYVHGWAPGTTTVTVTARNQRYSFQVTVQ